jgi:hypothetical protein
MAKVMIVDDERSIRTTLAEDAHTHPQMSGLEKA